jgi:hypothetical protein
LRPSRIRECFGQPFQKAPALCTAKAVNPLSLADASDSFRKHLVLEGQESTFHLLRNPFPRRDSFRGFLEDHDVDSWVVAKGKRRFGSVAGELLKKEREAMLAAVQIFNSPQIEFKSELFIVTTVIAWTYLLHAWYRKKGIEYRPQTSSDTRQALISREASPHNAKSAAASSSRGRSSESSRTSTNTTGPGPAKIVLARAQPDPGRARNLLIGKAELSPAVGE